MSKGLERARPPPRLHPPLAPGPLAQIEDMRLGSPLCAGPRGTPGLDASRGRAERCLPCPVKNSLPVSSLSLSLSLSLSHMERAMCRARRAAPCSEGHSFA